MLELKIKGKFRNNKERVIRILTTEGIEVRNYFNDEERMYLSRELEGGSKCFNWNIWKNKFQSVELELVAHYGMSEKYIGKNPFKFKFDLEKLVGKNGAYVRNGRIYATEIIELCNELLSECEIEY